MCLAGSNLISADLRGVDLDAAHLQGADLTGAILHGATLANADLLAVSLGNAILDGTNPHEVELGLTEGFPTSLSVTILDDATHGALRLALRPLERGRPLASGPEAG